MTYSKELHEKLRNNWAIDSVWAGEHVPDLLDEIDRLTAANKWVSVSERLPEKDSVEVWEEYLCKLNRYGDILIAPLYFIGGGWYSGNRSRYDEFVIEWQPLPTPPTGGENE